MTEIAGATCPTCSTALSAAGAPCERCAPPQAPSAQFPSAQAPSAQAPSAPFPSAPYQAGRFAGPHSPTYPVPPYPAHTAPPQPPQAYPAYPQQAYPQQAYPQPAYAQYAYPPAPFPTTGRPAKSAGVAILLTLLWIGAGHLYLDRVGTGLLLMGAHFLVGVVLAVVFFPLGFLVWLAAAIGCSVWCSTLAGQINAGTAPPRETW